MKKKLTIAIVLLNGLILSAWADPIVVGTGFSPPEFTALLSETVIVAILLARRNFDFVRVLYTWFWVTLVTYWFLMICGYFSVASLSSLLPNRDIVEPIVFTVIFLVLESLVVCIEAWVIMSLAKRRFFRNSDTPFTKKSAIFVSIVGNIVSLVVGMVWMYR